MDNRVLEYLTAFTTGLAILILELISFRLLAPYFGASSYIIGIIINNILFALAIGYFIGGYTADRFKSHQLPYFVILGASLYLIVIFSTYSRLLPLLSSQSLILGSFMAILVMFFIPMVLLAFVPPYLIKLLVLERKVGITSGKIFSISTLGSIVGGVLTTFVFIPNLGSRSAFLMTIVVLLMVTIIGLIKFHKLYCFSLLFLLTPCVFTPKTINSEYIHQTESEYNIISVTDCSGKLFLKLNDNFGFHSVSLEPKAMLSHTYHDYYLFAQMLIDAKQTLILGNGAGTSMMQIAHFFGTEIDAVEIDPKLTKVGQVYFGLDLNNTKLTLFHEDARTFLAKNNKKYDIINIDIYSGSHYVPFHVATVEFFRLVKQSLNENGILVINIPFYALDNQLGEYYLNTITTVFPNSYISDHMLYAFKTNLDQETVLQRIKEKKRPQSLNYIAEKVFLGLEKLNLKPSENIFTDDYAPIDKMTFEILKGPSSTKGG